MSAKELQRRLKGMPVNFVETLNDKQKRVVLGFSNEVKLSGVLRWKQRLARSGIKSKDLADQLNKPTPRISEWVNLKKEPSDVNFYAMESALFLLGA